MLRMGVPIGSVCQKMVVDGVDARASTASRSPTAARPRPRLRRAGSGPPPGGENDTEEEVAKYAKMLRMGVPIGSVCQKMVADGVDGARVERFAFANGGATLSGGGADGATARVVAPAPPRGAPPHLGAAPVGADAALGRAARGAAAQLAVGARRRRRRRRQRARPRS